MTIKDLYVVSPNLFHAEKVTVSTYSYDEEEECPKFKEETFYDFQYECMEEMQLTIKKKYESASVDAFNVRSDDSIYIIVEF